MEIKDLVGLSQPLNKLIEVISSGVGELSKPYLARKNADAKAYEIKAIAEAIKENHDGLKSIGFNREELNLISLDNSLKGSAPSLESRSLKRIDFREQKRQENIENITQEAAENLSSEYEVSDDLVDKDWISRFFDFAEDISNEEMQRLWGKILAGEVKKPKSYSLRTLDTLRNLSADEAEVFIKFGSFAIHSGADAFLLQIVNENILQDQNQLEFGERLLLEELGLIATKDLEFQIVKTNDEPKSIIFTIGSTIIVQEKQANIPFQGIGAIAFTKTGKELLQLVDEEPTMEYLQLFASKLNRNNGAVKYATITEHLPSWQFNYTKLIDVPLTEIEKKAAKEKAMNQTTL